MDNTYSAMKKFINALTPEANAMEMIPEFVTEFATAYRIAKIVIYFESVQGNPVQRILYDIPDFIEGETERLEYRWSVLQGGEAVMYVNKLPNTIEWTREEHVNIEVLANLIYTYIGKQQVFEFAESAYRKDTITCAANASGLYLFMNSIIGIEKSKEYTALYFNIRKFKDVNHFLGFEGGNGILRTLARDLVSLFDEEEILGRMGSDNFAAFVKKKNLGNILDFLYSYHYSIEKNGMTFLKELEFSIGGYQLMDDDYQAAVDKACSAYRIARARGTDTVVFYDGRIHTLLKKEKELEERMYEALNMEEFKVYYQPKVNLYTEQLIGAEALVRWELDGEILTPNQFIPLFEKNGFVCDLDFYMLEHVCRDLDKWLKAGLEPVTVSVNFSKLHLTTEHFADFIVDMVNKYKIPHHYIEIELTETSYVENLDALQEAVNVLKNAGILVSMDDFGTGYSSLSLLIDVHMDVLKIDKSFMTNNISKREKIVIKNIIQMGKDLKMQIVAEGVETNKQAEFLKSIQCNIAQGYLYDKPLVVSEFEWRLQNKQYKSSKENLQTE